MEREPFGFTPSFAPRSYERRTSRWGQAIEHGPESTPYVIDLASNPTLTSRYVRPHVARDEGAVSMNVWWSAGADGGQRSCAGIVQREVAIERGQLERAPLRSPWAGDREVASGVV